MLSIGKLHGVPAREATGKGGLSLMSTKSLAIAKL
jgi:hypothetical protein